jgi:hypothetical protein
MMAGRRGSWWAALLLLPGLCRAQGFPLQEGEVPTFGTTVVMPSGLRGEIYYINEATQMLPKFEKLEPVGAIYTNTLNVPPRDFKEGFPGVTKRYEWFAIDYKGRFWIEKPGKYRFALMSDDGSKLYIDERLVIDNDYQHQPLTMTHSVELAGGIHTIRVSYFQGPRYQVALVLSIAPPGERWRVFNTDQFKPPPNPENWKYDEAAKLQVPDPDATRTKLREAVKLVTAAKPGAAADAEAAVLDASPLPHAFDVRLAVEHLRYEGGSWQSALVISMPGRGLATTPDPASQTLRVHVSLLARLKDAGGEVVDEFRLDVPREIRAADAESVLAGPLTFTHPIRITPGRYTVEAAVIDHEAKRASASVIEFNSAEPRRGVGLSSVFLVEELKPASGKADESDPLVYHGQRVVPLLAPTERWGTKPAVYFAVYPDRTNAEKPKVQVELLVNGQPVGKSTADLPAPEATGEIPVLAEAALRDGKCELRITATQGGDSITESVRYTVNGE